MARWRRAAARFCRGMVRLAKGIYRVVFSRLFMTGLLLLLQLGAAAFLFVVADDRIPWLGGVGLVFSVIMCLLLIRVDDTAPEFKISWMALFLLMPIPAGLLYLMWGDKRPSIHLRHRLSREARRIEPLRTQRPEVMAQLEAQNPRAALTAHYLLQNGPFPVYGGSEAVYYPSGEDAFAAMLPALAAAEHFIFVEYFIIGLGTMWDQIHDILRAKAAAGLDVRVIYDDVGSVSVLPLNYWKKLEAEGIHSLPFNPFVPALNLVMNHRDHRKILVIDGHTAFTGGYNLADEYVNRIRRFGYWKDSGLRVRGEAAWSYTTMFLEFWNASRPTDADLSIFRPERHQKMPYCCKGFLQPFADSPVDKELVGKSVYLELIAQAQRTLAISTPYLILDDDIRFALTLAAKRGVRVDLYTPGVPDKKLAYQLTRSYFPSLIEAGVRVWRYDPGFLHAKTWLVDDKVGCVGSINLDYRSLYLHFESSTLLYGCAALRGVRADLNAIRAASTELTAAACRTGFFGTLLSALLRTMAPLF